LANAYLAPFLDSLQYTDGSPVPQVDLIAHSMGGLIVRAYLSGKQAVTGVFSPPLNPKVRKAIFLATPHFGSYQAANSLADILFFAGNQTNEMKPGSQFLWDLATWNQFGDDLRGVDALAIAGDAGTIGSSPYTSDGVVTLSSASLLFAEPDVRTRIVNYCHVQTNSGVGEAIEGSYLDCVGPGIAYIDTPFHQSYEIISSFLTNTTVWQAVGHPPSQDEYLDLVGGLFVAVKNTRDQYFDDLVSVELNNTPLSPGPSNPVTSVYYDDWLPAGSYNASMVSPSGGDIAGSTTSGSGGYRAAVFKEGPHIFSVQSSAISSLPGRTVQSGGTITISGSGFGQQCSGCEVLAAAPGSTNGYLLTVSSWTDQAISAFFLPATLPNLTIPGMVTIYVELSSSAWDSINIMTGPAASLTVAKTHTGNFAQGQNGATCTVTVSNMAGAGQTTGGVTVTETIPTGLTLVSMAGAGWSCAATACTRNDPLAAGASYSAITVTVNISSNAPSSVTNQVSVSGGTSATASASDPTSISAFSPCDLKHNGSINVADVQLIINEAGTVAPALNDLNGDGVVNVVDIQIEINAGLGLGCLSH
jgi:uncharacterized repeat protein (TIGR01451 family)